MAAWRDGAHQLSAHICGIEAATLQDVEYWRLGLRPDIMAGVRGTPRKADTLAVSCFLWPRFIHPGSSRPFCCTVWPVQLYRRNRDRDRPEPGRDQQLQAAGSELTINPTRVPTSPPMTV
jgi:hypothetical protein